MALAKIPSDATVIGRLEIVRYITSDGEGFAFGWEDMPAEFAIGALQITQDRLREVERLKWDTCPECGLPWDDHEEADEEEEGED